MLSFPEEEKALEEPKTARMEQRTRPHIKKQIQLAAALLGVDETAFVTTVAYERAKETIRDHEQTFLTADDRDVVLAALADTSEPTEAMKNAAALHKKLVRDG